MDVELINSEKSFSFNISPLMPISYLRTLAHKSFNIPEYKIVLSYNGVKIEKEYNETFLKDFFPKSLKITINVIESELKNSFRIFFNSTNSTSIKTTKLSKLIQDEKILISKSKKFKAFELLNSEEPNISKCEDCNLNQVEFFCREDINFLCEKCKNEKHVKHKFLIIEKGNIENCGNIYKKSLIEEIDKEEQNLKDLIKKDEEDIINDKVEDLYNIISKILKQIRDFLLIYPCTPIESIEKTDCHQIKKDIYSIENKNNNNKNKNCFSYIEKKQYFKKLQKKDFIIDNLRKDIESAKKKYNLQDFFIEIIDMISENLKNLSNNLDKIRKKKNIMEFTSDLDDLIIKQRKNFHLNKEEEKKKEKKVEEIDDDLEQIYFNPRKKKNYEYLPYIMNKTKELSMRNIPILKNYYSSNFIKGLKKDYTNNRTNPNLKKYNLNISSSSDSSKEKIKKKNVLKRSKKDLSYKRINHTINYNDKRDSDIRLDSVLLTENDINTRSPKRPKKRESTRLSIFIKNKMKMDNSTSEQIMKLKKKKKKM